MPQLIPFSGSAFESMMQAVLASVYAIIITVAILIIGHVFQLSLKGPFFERESGLPNNVTLLIIRLKPRCAA